MVQLSFIESYVFAYGSAFKARVAWKFWSHHLLFCMGVDVIVCSLINKSRQFLLIESLENILQWI